MWPLIEIVSTVLLFTTVINGQLLVSIPGKCTVNVTSLSKRQPVYVSKGVLLAPSDNSGDINFDDKQAVTMACPGNGNFLLGPTTNGLQETVLNCDGASNTFWNSGSLVDFNKMNCNDEALSTEVKGASCPNIAGSTIITVGLQAAGRIHTIITSCVDLNNAKVYYVEYDQAYNNWHAFADRTDYFKQGPVFPPSTVLDLNVIYKKKTQKIAFNWLLGTGGANQYITTNFLTRGHLAAAADFAFSPGQNASCSFVNVAPQWKDFNEGNWKTLEEALREHIADNNVKAKIYTGTWGILQLKHMITGKSEEIYLRHPNRKVPVPLWYYKVVREVSTGKATAFLGLNNPHVTLAEARALAFCTDRCAGNSAFSWLNWQNTNLGMGFSICCDIADFRRTVTLLPAFTANGGLFS